MPIHISVFIYRWHQKFFVSINFILCWISFVFQCNNLSLYFHSILQCNEISPFSDLVVFTYSSYHFHWSALHIFHYSYGLGRLMHNIWEPVPHSLRTSSVPRPNPGEPFFQRIKILSFFQNDNKFPDENYLGLHTVYMKFVLNIVSNVHSFLLWNEFLQKKNKPTYVREHLIKLILI